MDKYDLLDAMSGIRDEYIEAAARPGTDIGEPEPSQERIRPSETGDRPFRKNRIRGGFRRMRHWAYTAAVILCASILLPNISPQASSTFGDLPLLGPYFRLVTFRTYEYSDERSEALVEEPAVLTMGSLKTQDSETRDPKAQDPAIQESEAAESAIQESETPDPTVQDSEIQDSKIQESIIQGSKLLGSVRPDEGGAVPESYSAKSDLPESEEAESEDMMSSAAGSAAPFPTDPAPAESGENGLETAMYAQGEDVSLNAALSAARINAEIRKMAEDCVQDFEKDVAEGTGYRSLHFTHEVVTDSEEWFCLAVRTYTSSADGFEQTVHFVINKKTGQWVTLTSLFGEDTDYVTPISLNIMEQMRARMAADPDIEYWIDSKDEPEMDFSAIRPDQDFYIDENGDLVICFDELEAAPMYMGTVEFTIPQDVISDLKK